MVRGHLSDHYDPRSNVVRLSQDVYYGKSITSVSVAAHECGHAIQHAKGYLPLQLRSSLVPVVNFASNMSWILIAVAFFRELLGSGKLFGFQVIPDCFYEAGYMNNGLMMMPSMALILVACIIWVHRSLNKELQEK